MTITIDEIESARVTLVAQGEPAGPPPTPGDVLRAEFLDELDLSACALAKAIDVPMNWDHRHRGRRAGNHSRRRCGSAGISECRRSSSCNLQTGYDLRLAAMQEAETLARILPRGARIASAAAKPFKLGGR